MAIFWYVYVQDYEFVIYQNSSAVSVPPFSIQLWIGSMLLPLESIGGRKSWLMYFVCHIWEENCTALCHGWHDWPLLGATLKLDTVIWNLEREANTALTFSLFFQTKYVFILTCVTVTMYVHTYKNDTIHRYNIYFYSYTYFYTYTYLYIYIFFLVHIYIYIYLFISLHIYIYIYLFKMSIFMICL